MPKQKTYNICCPFMENNNLSFSPFTTWLNYSFCFDRMKCCTGNGNLVFCLFFKYIGMHVDMKLYGSSIGLEASLSGDAPHCLANICLYEWIQSFTLYYDVDIWKLFLVQEEVLKINGTIVFLFKSPSKMFLNF